MHVRGARGERKEERCRGSWVGPGCATRPCGPYPSPSGTKAGTNAVDLTPHLLAQKLARTLWTIHFTLWRKSWHNCFAVGIGRRVPQGHPRGCGSRAAADAHGYGWLGGEVAAGVTIVQGCIVEGRVVAAHHGARHGGIRLVMVHARWEAAVVVAGVAVRERGRHRGGAGGVGWKRPGGLRVCGWSAVVRES
eukprot:1161201-Pelagomonas_calceolata.AAC.21